MQLGMFHIQLYIQFEINTEKRLIWPLERYQQVVNVHLTIHFHLHSIVFCPCARLYHQRHILRDRPPSTTACPACWAMGTNKLKQCMVKKNYIFCTGRLEVPRQDKNLLYRHDKPNETTKKGPLLFVLFESPFTWVSTVRRFPPLSSLSGYHALLCSGVLRWNWTPPPSPRQQIGRSLQQPSSQLPSSTTVQVLKEQQFRYLRNNSSGT